MEYQNLVKDFASRTVHNLEIVERAASQVPAEQRFEVTQLVNSLLGMIVLQREKQLGNLPTTKLSTLAQQGWAFPRIVSDHPKTRTLRDFVKFLRNAVAHFNVAFLAEDTTHEIYGLTIWNEVPGGTKDWEVDLHVSELRDLVVRLNDVIQNLP